MNKESGARSAPERNGGAVPLDQRRIAEAVRAACVQAAIESYEQAGMAGLCAEGRWEAAVDALRALNLDAILKTLD